MVFRDQQRDNDQISERLDLAYREINEINPQIVDRFGPFVKELDLSNNNLEKDLTILEGFKKLTTLVLDSNRITHHIKFPILLQLHTLWVNNNQISNLSIFIDKVIESFPNIRTFSMLKNEACPNFFNGHTLREYKDYRLYIISKLKNLQILDSTPVTNEEKLDAIKLYGQMNSLTQSLSASTIKPKPLPSDLPLEDDPKKKREQIEKQAIVDKELKRKEKEERREKRRIKRVEKEEKQYNKLLHKQEKQQQQQQQTKIKDEDDFTDEEDNSSNNNNNNNNKSKSDNINNSLPVFSSEQSPISTILPPIPNKQQVYDNPDMADDEAFTAESSDQSDLPLYKNNNSNNSNNSLLLSPPPPPPTSNLKIKHENDNDSDDDDDSDDDSDDSSEWSSDQDLNSDQDNDITTQLPTRLTIRDQYYQNDDTDDDSDDDSDTNNYHSRSHFPVRPPSQKYQS